MVKMPYRDIPDSSVCATRMSRECLGHAGHPRHMDTCACATRNEILVIPGCCRLSGTVHQVLTIVGKAGHDWLDAYGGG